MTKSLFVFLITNLSLINACCGPSCRPKPDFQKNISKVKNQNQKNKKAIQNAYGEVAKKGGFVCSTSGCCGGGSDLSQSMGYSQEDLKDIADANLGLGCGHPVNLGQIKKGNTVLDLGSGAGLDCFLAAKKTGETGKVIGVDMTPQMIKKARTNAKKYKYNNVTFKLGDIEKLPIESNSVDVVISNCVINLAPHKRQVFSEVHRVLKKGGRLAISDVVLTKNLTKEQVNNVKLLCACVSGAILKKDYLQILNELGFKVTIREEDKEIGKKWFGNNDLPIISIKFVATKK